MAKMVWQANDGKLFDTEEQADRWNSRDLLAQVIDEVAGHYDRN